MPRKLFEKEKTLQVHLTKCAHEGVFSRGLIFGKFEGSKFLLKKEIGINANSRRIPGTAHLHANFVFIQKMGKHAV